jgi:hypothetical protein
MRRYLEQLHFRRGAQGPLRILYLSCHGPLEHDELTLFGELGYRWVCLARGNAIARPRRTVRSFEYPIGCDREMQSHFGNADPSNAPKELLDWADVVIVMHEQGWLLKYGRMLANKPVIWRSIGQAVPETALAPARSRLFCVRMSPREHYTAGFVGSDAIIRFYKNENEFSGWTGADKSVVAVMGMPNLRRPYSRVDVLEQVMRQLPGSELYGLDTDRDLPGLGRGTIGYEPLKERLRRAGVFLTVGSFPGPYTLSLIEAMMLGCPVVSVGTSLWASQHPRAEGLYETPSLLGEAAVVADSASALLLETRRLLQEPERARALSKRGRARAIELFGKEQATGLWSAILNPIGERT